MTVGSISPAACFDPDNTARSLSLIMIILPSAQHSVRESDFETAVDSCCSCDSARQSHCGLLVSQISPHPFPGHSIPSGITTVKHRGGTSFPKIAIQHQSILTSSHSRSDGDCCRTCLKKTDRATLARKANRNDGALPRSPRACGRE